MQAPWHGPNRKGPALDRFLIALLGIALLGHVAVTVAWIFDIFDSRMMTRAENRPFCGCGSLEWLLSCNALRAPDPRICDPPSLFVALAGVILPVGICYFGRSFTDRALAAAAVLHQNHIVLI